MPIYRQDPGRFLRHAPTCPGPGAINTTYIVGHSSDGVDTAFNNLSSRARIGDQLTVTTADGPQPYQVLAISTENKNTLKDPTG